MPKQQGQGSCPLLFTASSICQTRQNEFRFYRPRYFQDRFGDLCRGGGNFVELIPSSVYMRSQIESIDVLCKHDTSHCPRCRGFYVATRYSR